MSSMTDWSSPGGIRNTMPEGGNQHWASLSPERRKAFATDIYLRESLADLTEIGGETAVGALGELALFTFKPDAVIGRRMRPSLDFLTDNGFTPIAVAPVRYTRHSMRELWRYNWDTYTPDRLALTTLMHTAAESLLLLLRDAHFDGGVPASVRLSELKGPAIAEKRRAGQLREILAPPNEIINFVHVADEPGDVVRELAIFADRSERRRLWREVLTAGPETDRGSVASAEVARLEQAHDSHDFDFDRSIERLAESHAVADTQLERLRAARQGGPRLTFDELASIVDHRATGVGLWDFVSIACGVLELVRDGNLDLLPAADGKAWAARSRDAGVASG